MSNKILIPLVVLVTIFATLYVVYSFQSGKKISVGLSQSKAARVTDETSGPGDYFDVTIIVEGFIGWFEGTFSGSGGGGIQPQRY